VKTAQLSGFTYPEQLDRTQEVAGSSPASSMKDLQKHQRRDSLGRLEDGLGEASDWHHLART